MLKLSCQNANSGKSNLLLVGCFDMKSGEEPRMHVGHMSLIHAAKKLGNVIVLLNDDESMRKLKGENRPFYDAFTRLKYITQVIEVECDVFNGTEEDVIRAIKIHDIDFIVKGLDTVLDKKYDHIQGSKHVRGIIYIDHGNLDIHVSDQGMIDK